MKGIRDIEEGAFEDCTITGDADFVLIRGKVALLAPFAQYG